MDELTLAMLSTIKDRKKIKAILKNMDLKSKMEIAESPYLKDMPYDFIELLANDKFEVRRSLASNHILKDYPEIVEKLANDRRVAVKSYLASNRILKYYPEIVEKLAKNNAWEIKQSLIFNNSALMKSKKAIQILMKDKKKYIRNILAEQISEYPELMKEIILNDCNSEVKQRLAENKNIGKYPEIINLIANNELWVVRLGLAENESIVAYPEIVKKLSEDKEQYIRMHLAENPAIVKYPDILEKLANDNLFVRIHLTRNPDMQKFPSNIIHLLINDSKDIASQLCLKQWFQEKYPEYYKICKERNILG